MNNKEEITAFMENVAFLRRQNKLTKKKMCEILGIGILSLNKIEKGQLPKRITVEVIFKIKKYFGINASELFKKQNI